MLRKTARTPASPASAKAIDVRAPDTHRIGAERQRFEHAGPAANAAVEDKRDAAADRFRNFLKPVERGARTVDLPSAVVRDDEAVDAVIQRLARIVGMIDAFQKDRLRRVLAQKGELVPGERRVRIDRHEEL